MWTDRQSAGQLLSTRANAYLVWRGVERAEGKEKEKGSDFDFKRTVIRYFSPGKYYESDRGTRRSDLGKVLCRIDGGRLDSS